MSTQIYYPRRGATQMSMICLRTLAQATLGSMHSRYGSIRGNPLSEQSLTVPASGQVSQTIHRHRDRIKASETENGLPCYLYYYYWHISISLFNNILRENTYENKMGRIPLFTNSGNTLAIKLDKPIFFPEALIYWCHLSKKGEFCLNTKNQILL